MHVFVRLNRNTGIVLISLGALGLLLLNDGFQITMEQASQDIIVLLTFRTFPKSCLNPAWRWRTRP